MTLAKVIGSSSRHRAGSAACWCTEWRSGNVVVVWIRCAGIRRFRRVPRFKLGRRRSWAQVREPNEIQAPDTATTQVTFNIELCTITNISQIPGAFASRVHSGDLSQVAVWMELRSLI